MKRLVLLLLVVLGAAPFAQTPTFELPAPTGKFPIGTTRWVVTDASREEIFAPGKKHDIEVIAWYPSSGATRVPGAISAPYIRDSMEEVLSFARLARLGDAFNGLEWGRTPPPLEAPRV